MQFRRTWTYRQWEKLALRLSDHVDVDGLWVGVLDTGGNEKAILERTRRALELIKRHDPYRYRLVLAEIRRLWVYPLPGDRSQWVAEDKRCMLDPRVVLGEPIEQVAASLVHAAMNARIVRYEVPAGDYVRRQRIARACMQQEILFAKHLPDAVQLTEWIDARIAAPADFWADRSFRDRHAQGERELANYAGIPGWAMKTAHAVRRVSAWMR